MSTSQQLLHGTFGGAEEEFTRHRGPVTSVAPVPGRDAVVTGAYDGAVALFDLARRSTALIGYHDHLTNKVTVDADGRRAASASSDYTVAIWDLADLRMVRRLLGHSDDVEDFTFADAHTGVSVSRDRRVIVWDLDTGAIRRIIAGHDRDVLSVACAQGRIYTSGDDRTLRVWDLETGRELHRWGPFDDETDTCAFDASRQRVVLGCDDGAVRVFDMGHEDPVAEFEAHSSGIKKVAVSPANGDILTAAYDQRLLVWDAGTLALKTELERAPTTWERSFGWSPDGSRLFAGSFDGTLLVWDVARGALADEIGDTGVGNPCFNDVAAGADGVFVTVSDDGRVRRGRLDGGGGHWSAPLKSATGRVLANAVALDEERGVVISGCHDQKVRYLELDRARADRDSITDVGEGPINCLRVAHHPGYEHAVFAACYSGAVVRIGAGRDVEARLRVHDGAVKALTLHPERPLAVSCSADGEVLSWDFDGRIRRRFPGHVAIVDDVDIDPSGRLAASVSRDFTLRVYELDSGALVHSHGLGLRSPKAVCFWDPSTVIVSNYWGALIRVDLDSHAERVRAVALNGISSLARCRDGVLATSYDGGVYLVDASDLHVRGELRAMTQRLQPSALFREARPRA